MSRPAIITYDPFTEEALSMTDPKTVPPRAHETAAPQQARGDQEKLHQTLRFLNKGLKKIRFHAQKGAWAITWETV
jgi:hypothetical protein